VWGWSRTMCGRPSEFFVDLHIGRNVLPYMLIDYLFSSRHQLSNIISIYNYVLLRLKEP
jgi:hypothetical protein